MKILGHIALVFTITLTIILPLSPANAADFDWMVDLNISAKADLPGFMTDISARFNTVEPMVKTVIHTVDHPADAFMVFHLAELSRQPVEQVLTHYKAEKSKGWGKMAASLGIKPGSSEFHQMKQRYEFEPGAKTKSSKGKKSHSQKEMKSNKKK